MNWWEKEEIPVPKPGSLTKYTDAPFLRRSGTHSAFMLVHLLTCGAIPLLLITCIVLLTGDIYYDDFNSDGTLKPWSVANKVAAVVFLFGTFVFLAANCAGVFLS